jgi:hypothetical protein
MMMRALSLLGAAAIVLGSSAAHASVVTVDAAADLFNLNLGNLPGANAVAVDVTGLTSVTFSVSPGKTVTVNNSDFNDADGVGAASASSLSSGGNGISGLTAQNAGYLVGAFVGSTLSPTAPSPLDFTGGTTFTTLSPQLQQSFFIGDGLTGDGSGATQVFNVPSGATTLYLGFSDACGYFGAPGCFNDNLGSFAVTTNGVAVPEPGTWVLMLLGIGGIGASLRARRAKAAIAA